MMHIPPPVAPVMPPSRFVKRGGFWVCLNCNLVADYCRCASRPPAETPASDGADSGLAKRIADARTKAGGR